MEKTFRRLLISTEKLLEEKSIEDWKLDQVNHIHLEIYLLLPLVCECINKHVK